MRKTISLTSTRHKPPQALAAVKNTLRKYVRRERKKELPEEADYWDFDCKIGLDEASAEAVHLAELVPRLDVLAQGGALEVYVEILARPERRRRRTDGAPSAGDAR
jgi:hypothetical protein